MKPLMTIVPIVALAALVATPSFAAGKKHVRHHHRVMNSYAYDQAPQKPVFFNGRMIGRANDPNIRYQMRNDEALKYQ